MTGMLLPSDMNKKGSSAQKGVLVDAAERNKPGRLPYSLPRMDNNMDTIHQKQANISVALCTYNGAAYLKPQLESLAAQDLLPLELVVTDDASTDDSAAIVNRFAAAAPFPVTLRINRRRAGVAANFSRAAALCRGDYVAFCDQDDCWLPHRLKSSLRLMLASEATVGNKTPLLVYSDPEVIDATSRTLAPSFMKEIKLGHPAGDPLPKLLVQNFVVGCTTLVNRPLLKVALPVPDRAALHDWWFALVAAASGRILFDPLPAVRYRRHDDNVVGPQFYLSFAHLASRLKTEELALKVERACRQARALKDRLDARKEKVPPLLEGFIDVLDRGRWETVRYCRAKGIARQDLPGTLALYYLLARRGPHFKV